MRIERLVALYLKDKEMYKKYRENMIPILKEYKGDFSYDFEVSKTLISQDNEDINRVFVIGFESEEYMDGFFNDDRYLKVRKKYYEPAVLRTTEIARYNNN